MDDLHRPAREYTRAALALLSRCCASETRNQEVSAEWVRASEDHFTRRQRLIPDWYGCVEHHQAELSALRERPLLDEALQRDPAIAVQLGKLVGVPRTWRTLTLDEVCNYLPREFIRRADTFDFDTTLFDDIYADFCTGLLKDRFEYVAIAPLLGADGEAPIAVSPNISIDTLTDSEIGLCLDSRRVPPWMETRGPDMIWPLTQLALRTTFNVMKQVGGQPTNEEREAASVEEADAVAALEKTLEGLHVYNEGRVSAPRYITYARHSPAGGSTAGILPGRTNPRWKKTYILGDYDHVALPTFYAELQRARRNPIVDAACRRFSYASDRDRSDDAIVDLMVAAESLFLADSGSPSQRSEMR